MTNIVITGSTRGIGFGLADAFLERGCRVMISGRKEEVVRSAAFELAKKYGSEKITGVACDVSVYEQVAALWDAARQQFGQVDVWINNAGQTHLFSDFWDLEAQKMQEVVETNILGSMYGVKVAVKGMLAQGYGTVYNMEGFGSRGRRMIAGMALYGSTKSAVAFLTDSLIVELKGKPVHIGSILPGMVVTDMLRIQQAGSAENWERSKRAFNILADRVETIAPWIADQVLANKENGRRIRWLNGGKILLRFLSAPFTRRNVID